MAESEKDCYERFEELLALPLAEFAEVTRGINPKPCISGFEPEAFLRNEAHLSNVPVDQLQGWLTREYLDGERIFNGWVQLAAMQATLKEKTEGDHNV